MFNTTLQVFHVQVSIHVFTGMELLWNSIILVQISPTSSKYYVSLHKLLKSHLNENIHLVLRYLYLYSYIKHTYTCNKFKYVQIKGHPLLQGEIIA